MSQLSHFWGSITAHFLDLIGIKTFEKAVFIASFVIEAERDFERWLSMPGFDAEIPSA